MILGMWLLSTLSVQAQVFGVPVSDYVVEGDIEIPGADVIHFSAREGTMVTIHDDAAGYTYGLIPTLGKEDAYKSATFTPFDILPSEDGEERAVQMKDAQGKFLFFEAPSGKPTKLQTDKTSLEITVKRISRWRFPSLSLISPRDHSAAELQNYFSSGICCVSCGEMTVCGGGVVMGCGSCSGGGGRMPI
jgi:hypothetical protein